MLRWRRGSVVRVWSSGGMGKKEAPADNKKKKAGWKAKLMSLLAPEDSDDSISAPSDDDEVVAGGEDPQKVAERMLKNKDQKKVRLGRRVRASVTCAGAV